MKRGKTLQEWLVEYLSARPNERIAKGELADKARALGGYTGETVGRRLRVLHEASGMIPAVAPTGEHKKAIKLLDGGSLGVEHRDRNHCFYYYIPPAMKTVRRYVPSPDGKTMMEIIETVSTTP